jgi:hypothetical protein
MKHHHGDHPKPLSKPGVLSCEEIRYWLKELFTNPELGWSKTPTALARALGYEGTWARQSVKSKIRERNRAWIYPSEQVKLSVTLPRILAGEVEPVLLPKPPGRRGLPTWGYRAVEQPQSIVPIPKKVMRFTVGGRLEFDRKAPPAPPPRLPAYSTWLQNPERWAPKSEQGPE